MPTRRTGRGVIGGKAGAVNAYGYIRGGPELVRALKRLQDGMSDEALKGAALAGAKVLEEAWKQRVESSIGRGPGVAHYADAIQASSRKGKKGATGIVGLKPMATSAGEAHPREYAARFEFGSARATRATLASGRSDFSNRGRTAMPTLRPAYDASERRMLDAMSDELRRLIEKAS